MSDAILTVTDEVWLPIAGYEDLYEVSDCGQVRSITHKVWQRGKHGMYCHTHHGRILKASLTGNSGYKFVGLSKNGVISQRTIHTIVAIAFVQNPEGKPEVAHKDHDKMNCRADNLEWTTHLENVRQSVRDRRNALGSKMTGAKLHEALIPEIFARLESGELQREVAVSLGVSQSLISMVKNRRKWNHD